jgi:hypothetical protein
MIKLLGVAVAALMLLSSAEPAQAQGKGTATSRLRLARAMCTTGPCNPSFDFRAGSAQFKRLKQPKPLTKRDIGRLRIDGVSSSGPPLPASLDGVVTARVNYDGVDPDADCALTGGESTQVIATSSLSCRTGGPTTTSCRGDIVLSNGVLDDPDCTDVQLFITDVVVEVYEDGGVGDDARRIAQNGALMTGKTPDCNSGGAGCP